MSRCQRCGAEVMALWEPDDVCSRCINPRLPAEAWEFAYASRGIIVTAARRCGVPVTDDVISEGLIALARSFMTHDAGSGASPITYGFRAVSWALQNERRPVEESIDTLRRGDEAWTLAEVIPAPPLLPDADATDLVGELVGPLLDRLNYREQVMVTHPCRIAAEMLGMQVASVRRQRVRIYARLRSEVAA